ncbi:hypothetical protein PO909_027671 [Leuciscus waleckii]
MKMFLPVLLCLCFWRLDAITLDPHTPSGPVSPTALITAVAVVGSLLIVAVIGMFCYCRKHRDEDQNHDQTDSTLYKHFGQMKESEMTEVIYTNFTF